MPAIQIHGAGHFAFTGIRVRIQHDTVAGLSAVLMVVVAEVFNPNLRLVPTVRRHGGPAELERQEHEQEDGKEASHGRQSSSYRDFLGSGKATFSCGFTTPMREHA